MCQSSGAAGVPVSHHAGQKRDLRTVAFKQIATFFLFQTVILFAMFFYAVLQLCVESCPDRHLTLVKAKLGNKEDREYYKQYCKEGVDFAKLVSHLICLHFMHIPEMKYTLLSDQKGYFYMI